MACPEKMRAKEIAEMAIRLMSVDDHPLIKVGLKGLFDTQEDFDLVTHCSEAKLALGLVREHKPDIVILDIKMPGMDGLVLARQIIAETCPPWIVLYAAEIGEEQMLEAIRIGVRGIVLKEMPPQLLLQCIRKVYTGEKWIERRSTSLTLEHMLRREAGARNIASVLTQREVLILKKVSTGLRNKEIATELFISEGTVKVHLHNIYEKIGVDGRLALLNYAREQGLL